MIIGWNASREAARALNDALPILEKADAVKVLTVGEDDGRHIPGADIARHLARHESARADPGFGEAFGHQGLEGGDGGGPRQPEAPGKVAGGGQLGARRHRAALDQTADGRIQGFRAGTAARQNRHQGRPVR